MPNQQKFYYNATVERLVRDTVSLAVLAEDDEEARLKAQAVLERYPREHSVQDVPYCYIENRDHLDINVTDIERMVPVDGGPTKKAS